MNRRNQEIISDEALVAHLVKNYTYDRERGVVVNKKLRRVVKGTIDTRGYLNTRIRLDDQHPNIRLHHIVWVVVHGRLPTQIDHINGDKTDNRIENLREVSPSENMLNMLHRWRPNARTGLPGVYKYRSGFRIKTCKKRFRFPDKFEAFHALVLLGRMFKEN